MTRMLLVHDHAYGLCYVNPHGRAPPRPM